MPLSNYMENAWIDMLFRTATYAKPSTIYIALFTTTPTPAGGGVEVSGGSYARAALNPLNTNWLATQGGTTGVSSGTSGQTKNAVAITFPAPTADWGTIVAFGIFDAITAGNLVIFGSFATSKVVSNGDQAPAIAINGLTLTFA